MGDVVVGGVLRHVNLLVPPRDPRAHMGNIILERETRLLLEMPGGPVEMNAECRGGRVTAVRFANLPSFAARLDAALDVPGFGSLTVDIAFGGDSFVIADAGALGFQLLPEEAPRLREAGMAITRAADAQLGFRHPTLEGMAGITFCLLRGPVTAGADGTPASRHAVTIRPGKLDRSPTGTGVSARLAVMHARGEIALGEPMRFESVLGSSFEGRLLSETTVGDLPAVIPEISGRAWITETKQLLLADDDPWPTGYRVADTWPVSEG